MMEKYIKELLFEYNKVYIPKIGSLVKTVESDVDTTHTYSQPKTIITVEKEYVEDSYLVNAIARGEHISTEEAESMVNEKVEGILDHINSYQYYEFENLGKLSRDTYGNFYFETSPAFQEENFGLPNEITGNPVDEDGYSSENKGSDYTAVWIISIILIASAVIVYFVFFKNPKKEDSELSTNQPTQVDTTAIRVDTTTTIPTTNSGNTTITKKTGRYYIIVGSFEVQQNAIRYREKLASQGFDAKILQPSYKNVYRVTIADFTSFREASTKAQEVKSEYELWILRF